MRPGRFQNPSKTMTNVTRGASGGVSGARLFQERVFGASIQFDFHSFGATWLILGAALAHWFLKGVPKSHFFNINQHKRRKSQVKEGVLKKH